MKKMLPHQKRTGMTQHYVTSRIRFSYAAERRWHPDRPGGDTRLFDWIRNFKPFLTWGKP